jgi:hypothetical protein
MNRVMPRMFNAQTSGINNQSNNSEQVNSQEKPRATANNSSELAYSRPGSQAELREKFKSPLLTQATQEPKGSIFDRLFKA